jgi:uncharacterized protein YaeQ
VARASQLRRFRIELSDVQRQVYQSLDLRVAQHPSESERFLCARVLAFALEFDESLRMGKGLSTTEEPTMMLQSPDGRLLCWIDVGVPGAERLHRASKASERVAVYAHKDPRRLFEEAAKKRIHQAERIEVFGFEPSFLDQLAGTLEREVSWIVVREEDRLFVSHGEQTLQSTLSHSSLA